MISLSPSLASKPVFLSLSLLPLILATDDDLEKQIENSGKKYLFCELHRFPHIETSIVFIILAVYEMTLKSIVVK